MNRLIVILSEAKDLPEMDGDSSLRSE